MILRQARVLATISVFVMLALPLYATAAGVPTQIVPKGYNCDQKGGCDSICAVVELAQNVLNFGIFFAVVISAFLFAWAGWNMLTSGGNTEVYQKGKRVFGNVLIGLIMILAGYIVIDTLMKTFTGTGLTGRGICMIRDLLEAGGHLYA